MFAGAIADVLHRSIENPSSSLSDPDDWVFDTFAGGKQSSSGIRVNHQTALTYAAVWRGINLISRDVAKIPLVVYRRLPGGGKERDLQHPAFRLLRRKPNPEMKAFDLKQTLMAHALLQGNGYAYIFRRGNGTPESVVPLNPVETYPVRENGTLWYLTRVHVPVTVSAPGSSPGPAPLPGKELGGWRKLRPEDVLHIKGLGYDGLVGYDVITVAKETLGIGLAMRKYGSIFFKNHAVPGVVLEHPLPLTAPAQANILKGWQRLVTGLDRSHATMILAEGMKAKILSIDARKAQLKEMREFELREVANFLGVPPHKLGDPTRTAFASLEQENQSYLNEALDGWLSQWEEECTDKMLTEKQNRENTHFCEFIREALVRADLATRTQALNSRVLAGVITRDEYRASENMNPLPDGIGKITMRPANMVLEDGEEEEPPPPTQPRGPKRIQPDIRFVSGLTSAPPSDDETDTKRIQPDIRFVSGLTSAQPSDDETDEDRSAKLLAAHRGLVESVARRFHRRIALQAVRAAGKPDSFVTWIDEEMPAKHRDAFVEAMEPVVSVLTASGRPIGPDDAANAVDTYLAEARESLLTAAECKASELTWRVETWATGAACMVGAQVWERMAAQE